MLPAHAPLPTASNFPFHPEAGSHTSILMSESLDGVSVAATRQNSGRFANGPCPAPVEGPRPGGVNSPAPTVCARVTATCGCANCERLSQVAPSAGLAKSRSNRVADFIVTPGLTGPVYF